jgi:hypothetical protein
MIAQDVLAFGTFWLPCASASYSCSGKRSIGSSFMATEKKKKEYEYAIIARGQDPPNKLSTVL